MSRRALGLILIPLLGAVLVPSALHAGWEPRSEPFPEDWGVPLLLQPGVLFPGHWLVATTRGVAVSSDGGQSFEYRPVTMLDTYLTSVVRDQAHESVLVAFAAVAPGPLAVVRSTDAGQSWSQVGPLDTRDWEIAASYGAGDELLAWTRWYQGCGDLVVELARSTDGGLTWSPVLPGAYAYSNVQLRTHPKLDEVWLLRPSWATGSGFFRSTDRGATWEPITLPDPFGSSHPRATHLALPSDADATAMVSLGYYSTPKPLILTRDGGETWTDLTGNLPRFTASGEPAALALLPGEIPILAPARGYPPEHTVPVLRMPREQGIWRPMSMGFPAGAEPALTGSCNPNLVIPGWSPETPYMLLRQADLAIRLYRWVEEPAPPMVSMAGWWPDRISSTAGGTLTLAAEVVDPDDDVQSVEIYHQGLATGVFLEELGQGLYSRTFDVPPGALPPGFHAFQLVATDRLGQSSDPWPSLAVGGPAGIPVLAPPAWAPGFGDPDPDHDPVIGAAGWACSAARGPTACWANLAAFVTDPDGPEDVNLVELMWSGLPTGLVLSTSYLGEFSAYDAYGLTLDLEPIPPGTYHLEIQARDDHGHRSGLWPYLTVDP